MPPYGTQNPPPALFPAYPQNQFPLFNADALTTLVANGTRYSQQVHIVPKPTAPTTLSIILDFSAAPGTFEIDVMEDDSDSGGSAHYHQIPAGGVMNTLNSGSTTQCTLELVNFVGQFLSLYIKTAPSNGASVLCTATVTTR